MAEEQAGDDDAFLYGEDAEQEEVNRGSGEAEGANGVGAAEESRPIRCCCWRDTSSFYKFQILHMINQR